MHLYLLNLGGSRSSSICEVHETRPAIATDLPAAVKTACAERNGLLAAHLDGYVELPLVAAPTTGAEQLFFIELGRNGPGMGEGHAYVFHWAESATQAASLARTAHRGWHVDNVFNLSRLADHNGSAIPRFTDEGAPTEAKQISLYRRISKSGSMIRHNA